MYFFQERVKFLVKEFTVINIHKSERQKSFEGKKTRQAIDQEKIMVIIYEMSPICQKSPFPLQ